MKRKKDKWGNKFQFDEDEELNIYKLLCREKISKRKLIKLDKLNCKFYTYKDWKKYVINKYQNYPKDCLVEFIRFLNFKEKTLIKDLPIIKIFMSALTGAACVYIFEYQSTKDFFTNIISALLILWSIAWIIDFYNKSDKVESCFYQDYKEIIHELIEKDEDKKI